MPQVIDNQIILNGEDISENCEDIEFFIAVGYPDGYLEVTIHNLWFKPQIGQEIRYSIRQTGSNLFKQIHNARVNKIIELGTEVFLPYYKIISYQPTRQLAENVVGDLNFNTYGLTHNAPPIRDTEWNTLQNSDFGHNIRTIGVLDAIIQTLVKAGFGNKISHTTSAVRGFNIGLGNYFPGRTQSYYQVIIDLFGKQHFPCPQVLFENTDGMFYQFDGNYTTPYTIQPSQCSKDESTDREEFDNIGSITISRAWYTYVMSVNQSKYGSVDVDFNNYSYIGVRYKNPTTYTGIRRNQLDKLQYVQRKTILSSTEMMPPVNTEKGGFVDHGFWRLYDEWNAPKEPDLKPSTYRTTSRYPVRIDITKRGNTLLFLDDNKIHLLGYKTLYRWGAIRHGYSPIASPWVQGDGIRDVVAHNVPYYDLIFLDRDLEEESEIEVNDKNQLGDGVFSTSSKELGTKYNALMGTGKTGFTSLYAEDLQSIYDKCGFKLTGGHRIMFALTIPAHFADWIVPNTSYIGFTGKDQQGGEMQDSSSRWNMLTNVVECIEDDEYITNNSNVEYRTITQEDINNYPMLKPETGKPEGTETKPFVLFKERDICTFDMQYYAQSVYDTAKLLTTIIRTTIEQPPFILDLLEGGVISIQLVVKNGNTTQIVNRLPARDMDGLFNAEYFIKNFRPSKYKSEDPPEISEEMEPYTIDTTTTGQILNPILHGGTIRNIKTPYGYPWVRRSDGMIIRVVD